jgi:ABC-type nickel/cobalt efflux system permease component RcnA
MDVIPLTLAISLLLSLTFIALFVREFTRPRRAGAEHDSLLPLETERPVVAAAREQAGAHRHAHDHAHAHGHAHSHANPDDVCASKRTDGKCCSSCQRRKDRSAARVAPKTDLTVTG